MQTKTSTRITRILTNVERGVRNGPGEPGSGVAKTAPEEGARATVPTSSSRGCWATSGYMERTPKHTKTPHRNLKAQKVIRIWNLSRKGGTSDQVRNAECGVRNQKRAGGTPVPPWAGKQRETNSNKAKQGETNHFSIKSDMRTTMPQPDYWDAPFLAFVSQNGQTMCSYL